MLVTGLLLTAANLSIEPILAVYVSALGTAPGQVTSLAGLVFSASALGSLLSASWLGRLADKVGPGNVIVGCLTAAAVLLVPQAFVSSGWQLLVWRFLLGCALGGLLPCLASVLRHAVPSSKAGRVLGLSTSAQYAGQVIGPVGGGFFAGLGGVPVVLLATSAILLAAAALNVAVGRRPGR